jgi:predicted DNA binding CopG/RHH family protein
MKNVDERAKFDDYEMADDYDFSEGVRGRFYQPQKIRATLQLDNDVLLFLKKQASEKHIKYQVLVNNLLRDYMSSIPV